MKILNKSVGIIFLLFGMILPTLNAQQITNGDFEQEFDAVEAPLVYPVPECYTVSSDYQLKINGVNVPLIEHRYVPHTATSTEILNLLYGSFYFNNTVTVELIKNIGSINNYSISPKRFNITPEQPDSQTLKFAIDEPRRLYIKVDGLEILVFGERVLTNQPPNSGTGIFNIADFGATSSNDNSNNQVSEIQTAIDAASSYGVANGTQGTVYIPAGVYYTTELQLKNNIDIYIEGGATVRGTGRTDDYGPGTSTKAVFLARGTDLGGGNADYVENIKIYGPGSVDANGLATAELPSNQNIWQRVGHKMRPISMYYVRNVTVEDVLAREGTSWQVSFHFANNIDVHRVKVVGHRVTAHNDGIDVESCKDARITNNFVLTVDDAFCVKDYQQFQRTESIFLDNNVAYAVANGFKLGYAGYNYIDGVTIQNGDVINGSAGVNLALIKSDGDGGIWENIVIDNITIENIGGESNNQVNPAIRGPFCILTDRNNAVIRNVTAKNINVLGNLRSSEIKGQDWKGHIIDNIQFTNFQENGAYATNSSEANMNVMPVATNVTFSVDPNIIPPVISNVPIPTDTNSWALNGIGAHETAGVGRNGGRALSLEPTASSWSHSLSGLTPGITYQLQGYIKTQNVTGGNAYLQVGTTLSAQTVSGTADWTLVTVEFTADAAALNVSLVLDATSGKAFFDDVEVTGTTTIPVTSISVSPTGLSIDEGQTGQLNATITPTNASDQNVSWASSDEAVATVNANGVVTGVSEGSAVITATSEDGSFTAMSNITVEAASTGGGLVASLDLEAESASGQSLFAPYTVVQDTNASGGEYINSNENNSTASETVAGQAAFDFELSESANVTFSALVDFPGGGDDSFFYRIDSESWREQNYQQTNGWETLTIHTFTNLSAGSHTLTILRRESGSKIDRITLSAPTTVIVEGVTTPTPEVSAIVELDPYGSNGWKFFQFRVSNTSEIASLTQLDLTIIGGGTFDEFQNTSAFGHTPDVAEGNDGIEYPQITVNFTGSGLAAGSSAQNGTNNNDSDLDGMVGSITVTATFSDGTVLSGTFTNVGDNDDGDPDMYQAVLTNGGSNSRQAVASIDMEAIPEVASVISIYPNPSSSVVQIVSDNDIQLLRIIDLQGRVVLELRNLSNAATLSVEGINGGLYLIKIKDKVGTHIKKLSVGK